MSFPPPSHKQARVMWFTLTTMAVAAMLTLIALTVWGLSWLWNRLSGVLLPLAFALVLAYILDPVVGYFERKKIPRLWAVILVYVLGLITLAAILGSVVPDLSRESRKLVQDLPANVEKLRGKLEHFFENSSIGRALPAGWRESLQTAAKQAAIAQFAPTNAAGTNAAITNLPNTSLTDTNTANMNWAAINSNGVSLAATVTNAPPNPSASATETANNESTVPGLTGALLFVAKWFTNQLSRVTTWVEFLIGFILVPVYLFYFLLEKDGIRRHWSDYMPMKESATKDELVFILQAINECMIVFFRGQVLVALCVGTLLTISYLILGLNYAILLGLVAAIFGIVPYLGTITNLVLAMTVAAVQFEDWTHPLIIFGIAATVKMLEDFLIAPRIMGQRSGLHPLTIIIAVLIGMTLLGGFLGALLAIPVTAVLRTLMFRYIWVRENPGKTPKDGTEFFHRSNRPRRER